MLAFGDRGRDGDSADGAGPQSFLLVPGIRMTGGRKAAAGTLSPTLVTTAAGAPYAVLSTPGG